MRGCITTSSAGDRAMFKNVASKVALFAFDTTTGVAKTGDAANLTAYVSKDWGAVTVLADTSATEMSSTNAPGWYLFDLAQAETNADVLLFSGKSSTANVSVVGMRIDTAPLNFTASVAQTGDSFARLGAPAGASVSADIDALPTNAELATALAGADDATLAQIALVKAKTDLIPASPAAVGDIPTVGAIADQVWDEAIAGHLAAGSTGLTLSSAGGAGDPWGTALPGAYGVGTAGYILGNNSGGSAGAGAITWTYTLTSSAGSVPIADADVWVTSDTGGTIVLASGRTDQNGVVTFYLDAGTIYVFRQKTGFNFNNPQTLVVTP